MRWVLSLLLWWIMAVGVTSDATDIMIFDDSDPAAGGDGSYSFADIFAVLGGTGVDVLRVDSGTGYPTYRFLKHLQIGDKTTNVATTTLKDKNVCVTFDVGKILKCRTTQTTSWVQEFGTKIGTGVEAGGRDGCHFFFTNTAGTNNVIMRGTVKLYASTFHSNWSAGLQAFVLTSLVNEVGEMIQCKVGGFSSHTIGANPSARMLSMYSNKFSSQAVPGTGNLFTVFQTKFSAKNVLMGDPAGSYIASGSLGVSAKDLEVFGTPVAASFQPTSATPNWVLVRPKYSASAPAKYLFNTDGTADNGVHEYRLDGVKCVDGATGLPVAGIAVRLSDVIGNVLYDVVSDVNGEVAFGADDLTRAVIVGDWHSVSSVTTLRHRGPFRREVNWPSSPSFNPTYASQDYLFKWPGSETVTNVVGAFEDTDDIIVLAAPPAPSVPPAPILVENVPVAAHGELVYQMALPSEVS